MFSTLQLIDSISYHEQLDTTALLEFIKEYRHENTTDDILTAAGTYLTRNHSLLELVQDFQAFVREKYRIETVVTGMANMVLLRGTHPAYPFLASIESGSATNIYQILKFDFEMSVTSTPAIADACRAHFEAKYSRTNAKINWWYAGRQGATYMSVEVADTKPMFDEFYPWFEEGHVKYFERYLESTASILFMAGPPGTGKTSYLRQMIRHFNLNTYITYDKKVMENDQMFISFITANDADVMLLEDAETTVLPRKSDNNHMITRFLNVSEGLIKFPRKKIIFTTNDSNFQNVDEAILRPGRCFDTVEFRSLTWNETVKAAEVSGLPVPDKDDEYTLAELFNGKKKKRRKVGFSA